MRLILLLVLFLSLGGTTHATELAVSNISVLPIHDGVNTVRGLAADGRIATVINGWRGNGNAHGYYVYLVLLPATRTSDSDAPPGVVSFAGPTGELKDTAAVSPFDGERVLGTLRFASADVSGVRSTIAIVAQLGQSISGALGDHAPVDISIYRLESPGVEPGTNADFFRLIKTITPKARFCNADKALEIVLHLPLPAAYAGGRTTDGCHG